MTSVVLDIDRVLGDLALLEDDLAGPALARALNRTATTVRTAMQRSARRVLNLRAKDINAKITQRRAVVRSLGGADAVITVSGKPSRMIDFGARETRAGVTVRIKRTGSRKVVKNAFIARTRRGGNKTVFLREGRKRLPINERFSTAVVQYLDDEVVLHRIDLLARTSFDKYIDHEIAFRLQKRTA